MVPFFLGEVAQLARARGSYPRCREFESPPRYADVAQSVERRLGKAEVTSSILVISSLDQVSGLIFFYAFGRIPDDGMTICLFGLS